MNQNLSRLSGLSVASGDLLVTFKAQKSSPKKTKSSYGRPIGLEPIGLKNNTHLQLSEIQPIETRSVNDKWVAWDSEIPGFGIRTYESGKKSYVFKYRHKNQQRMITIASTAVMTIEEARNRAKKLIVLLIDGYDPIQQRQNDRQGHLFKDLITAYIERHAKPHKRTWRADLRRLEIHVLPRWANREVQNIKRSDVALLHAQIGKTTKIEANRTLEVLSEMFNLAEIWGFVEEGAPNPSTKRIQNHCHILKPLGIISWLDPKRLNEL